MNGSLFLFIPDNSAAKEVHLDRIVYLDVFESSPSVANIQKLDAKNISLLICTTSDCGLTEHFNTEELMCCHSEPSYSLNTNSLMKPKNVTLNNK